jgi:hypothetical protein
MQRTYKVIKKTLKLNTDRFMFEFTIEKIILIVTSIKNYFLTKNSVPTKCLVRMSQHF